MNKFIAMLPGIIILIIMIIGSIWNYFDEKKSYNKGICPDCGGPWKSFDMDSSGAVGLICANGKHYTWISWLRLIKER